MRKIVLTLVLILYVVIANGQSPQLKELWKYSRKHEWEKVLEKGYIFLEQDSNNVEYNLMVGNALFQQNKIIESKPYFEQAATHNDPHSSIRARALVYLSLCYFLEGNYDKSKEALEECKKIKSYSKIKEYNENWYERLGYDEFFDNWQIKETDHFKFYFQDTTDLNYRKFIERCENAFTNIDTFFISKVPKKIDYFVWTSTIDARNIIKTGGAFAYTYLCLIHGNTNENEGHEIAHVISMHYRDNINKNKFITEGTAVYFDQTHLDKRQWLEDIMKRRKIKKVNVKDVWEKREKYPEDYWYNLSGLFIQDLIQQYGKDKFLEFFADQSYKNAKAVFGKSFDDFIKDFEDKFNKES